MIKFNKASVIETAKKITGNSAIYADELDSVALELSALAESANQLGCKLEADVADWYGGSVRVCAIPDKYKHAWSF